MMTMISAFNVKITPVEASNVRNMLSNPPPAAVTAPPRAKARAEARTVLMLTRAAAWRLTATARRVSPVRVRISQT